MLENYNFLALQALITWMAVRITTFGADDMNNPATRMTIVPYGRERYEVPRAFLMSIEPFVFTLMIFCLLLGFAILHCRPVCLHKGRATLLFTLYSTMLSSASDLATASHQTFRNIRLLDGSILHFLHLRRPQLSIRLRPRSLASVNGQD